MDRELKELVTQFVRTCKAKNFRREAVEKLVIISCAKRGVNPAIVMRTYISMLNDGKTEQDLIDYAIDDFMLGGEK